MATDTISCQEYKTLGHRCQPESIDSSMSDSTYDFGQIEIPCMLGEPVKVGDPYSMGGQCHSRGFIPCMAQELSIQVQELEREWPSPEQAHEEEDDSEEMLCSMDQLDMAALSSVVTSGVGISGALASARSSRDTNSAFNSPSTHVAPPSQTTEQQAFSTIAVTGVSSEAVESLTSGISESALSNWRAVLSGHGVRVAGAWRGCRKASTCNREPRHRGVCNTRASPPSLAAFSEQQLAAAGVTPQELSLLTATPLEEVVTEAPQLALQAQHCTAAFHPTAQYTVHSQHELLFMPFEEDDSDGSEFTALGPMLQSSVSDMHFGDALNSVAVGLGGPHGSSTPFVPLGALGLRWPHTDVDVSSARTQLGSLAATPTSPPLLLLSETPCPRPLPAVSTAATAVPSATAPTRNSRRLKDKAVIRAWQAPCREEDGDEVVPQPRSSLRLASVSGDDVAIQIPSLLDEPVLVPAAGGISASSEGPPVLGLPLGLADLSTQRPKQVLGNRNRKRGANGSLKGAFSSIAPAAPGQHCNHCGTNVTPVWRAGPKGPKTLCNACGVRWMKVKPRNI